jgi:hypothetical protein
MFKNVSDDAIRHMRKELDELEAQGRRELQDQTSRPVGLLRIDLIEECRRRLAFIAATMWRDLR